MTANVLGGLASSTGVAARAQTLTSSTTTATAKAKIPLLGPIQPARNPLLPPATTTMHPLIPLLPTMVTGKTGKAKRSHPRDFIDPRNLIDDGLGPWAKQDLLADDLQGFRL